MKVLIEGEGLVVGKAGGTSTATPGRLERQHDIIRADPRRQIWVLSAPGSRHEGDTKISRLLEQCYELRRNEESFDDIFNHISERYLLIGRALSSEAENAAERFVQQTYDGIKQGNWNLGQTVVQGELGIARVVAIGWGASLVDPTEIFKIQRSGRPHPRTYQLINRYFSSATSLQIVPGCYGADFQDKNKIVMFDWGGSDITADLIAEQVGDGHENWTDVKGVKAVDPRDIKAEDRETIPTISKLTYEEMLVLALRGAKVLHPRAILGCRRAGLPINIRNSFTPENPGTLIVQSREVQREETIIAITRNAKKQTVTLVGLNLGDTKVRAEVLERSKLVLGENSIRLGRTFQGVRSLTLNLKSAQTDQALRFLYTEFFS